MDKLNDLSPVVSQKIRIKKDLINSVETDLTMPNENTRTKRVKKPKHIEDLGFEEKPLRNSNKKGKKIKLLIPVESNPIIANKKIENTYCIFQKFKSNEYFSKFPCFHRIEKLLKNGQFQNHKELAIEIRKVFNNYFSSYLNNPDLYATTCIYSNFFEDIYREYENKLFSKDSKNILELKKKMNRLRREIREKNTSNLPIKNKLRIDINEFNLYSEKEKKISRKYKLSLVNNIRRLNSDQIKGIINIIHDNLNVDEKTMEFDVNNLPIEKLKELEKYVKKCLKHKKSKIYTDFISKDQSMNTNQIQTNHSNKLIGDNINVNININNNFMMGNSRNLQNSMNSHLITGEENNLNKRNSILSDSDSLSSDEESDSNSLSSSNIDEKRK